MYYLHTDNLGSILSVINASGTVVFKAGYDAWGKQNVISHSIEFHRGYTGHEMLPEFGLINMNGRVYDPILARFLSPDDYVQNPDDSQTFNRYSYCKNNPLIYTDPSGEFFWLPILAAAAIGGIMNVGMHDGNIQNIGDFLGYFGIGAVAGGIGAAAAAYVGAAVAGVTATEFATGAGVGGFAAGAISSAAGSAVSIPIQSGGNSIFYGEDFIGWDQYAYDIFGSAIISGCINGIVASGDGRSFWTGCNTTSAPSYYPSATDFTTQKLDYDITSTKLSPYDKGKIGVQRAMEEFVSEGGENVVTEVSLKVEGVTYRAVFVGELDNTLYIYEVKNGPHAGFTTNQKFTIPKLLDHSTFTPFGSKALDSSILNYFILQKSPYTGNYVFVLKKYY